MKRGSFKEEVNQLANELFLESGEFEKADLLAKLEAIGHDFGDIEELAKKQKLAAVNRVLSSIRIDGKRAWESVKRKDKDGKPRYVRVPRRVLEQDVAAKAYAKEQSMKRITGEMKRSPVSTVPDGQMAFEFFPSFDQQPMMN